MSCHFRSQESEDAGNPGNNLYVTGLSMRVTTSDLERFFSREGKVWASKNFSVNHISCSYIDYGYHFILLGNLCEGRREVICFLVGAS